MSCSCLLIATLILLAMPITGSGWAEGSNILLQPERVCKKIAKSEKLAELCNKTTVIAEITKGINMSFSECRSQFKNRRWNCTNYRNSMKKILNKDSREASFVDALGSAGITYQLTQACSRGDIIECSCNKDKPRKPNNNKNKKNRSKNNLSLDNLNDGRNVKRKKKAKRKKKERDEYNIVPPDGDWEWGGCNDNVNYGLRKSREFMDSRYKRRGDIKSLLKLHNNRAGRLAVKRRMQLQCTCHGLSGTCTIKTCWLKLPKFSDVASALRDRFDGAVKVIAENNGKSFSPEYKDPPIKSPEPQDLVYTEDSVDFCRTNHKTGSLGTVDRECNHNSQGEDGCKLLCCNRGFTLRTVMEETNCKCIFTFCCNVTCETCIEKREIYTCK